MIKLTVLAVSCHLACKTLLGECTEGAQSYFQVSSHRECRVLSWARIMLVTMLRKEFKSKNLCRHSCARLKGWGFRYEGYFTKCYHLGVHEPDLEGRSWKMFKTNRLMAKRNCQYVATLIRMLPFFAGPHEEQLLRHLVWSSDNY